MMHFIARLREKSGGKPTGFKFCVGHPWEWFAIVKAMQETDITPDFIVVDGAEGGTGAAPVEFTDHVGVPLQEGLLLVHNTLIGVGLRHRIKIGAAGKVITAFDIARMMALGADWCNAGRGFMMALGCIQAQNCHTGHCPTGVATQDAARQKALVVPDKATRVANFHDKTLHALQELVQAAGLEHPATSRPTTSCGASPTPRCASSPTWCCAWSPARCWGRWTSSTTCSSSTGRAPAPTPSSSRRPRSSLLRRRPRRRPRRRRQASPHRDTTADHGF